LFGIELFAKVAEVRSLGQRNATAREELLMDVMDQLRGLRL
jgi:hypothetical protein